MLKPLVGISHLRAPSGQQSYEHVQVSLCFVTTCSGAVELPQGKPSLSSMHVRGEVWFSLCLNPQALRDLIFLVVL
jgi:hypothetical protein